MNIAMKLISKLMSELLLLYEKELHESVKLTFYINNIFLAHDSFEKQYLFLKNHFLFRMLWVKLRLFFLKLSLFIIKVRALK